MEILVFGGTVFLSRAMAELAVARGHNVTTFNRGQSEPPVAGAVDRVTGDRGRPEDLEQLRGRHFDLVFDTAYLPEHARLAADLLEPGAAHYVYISSINAFPGWPDQADYRAGGVYDGDPDAVGDQVPNDLPDPEGSGPYGWRKVGCERSILRRFGEHRTSILRAGLIVGPKDRAGRLPWWLDRVARARAGESVLAPGEPDAEVRLIDCRDVAEFALRRPVGTFEISGPRRQITRRQLLDEIAEITRAQPEFVWIPDEALAGRVQMWTEMPMWVPLTECPGIFNHDTTAAEAAGLALRPVRDTIIDTWEWMRSIEGGWTRSERTPGLDPAKESELIRDWLATH